MLIREAEEELALLEPLITELRRVQQRIDELEATVEAGAWHGHALPERAALRRATLDLSRELSRWRRWR